MKTLKWILTSFIGSFWAMIICVVLISQVVSNGAATSQDLSTKIIVGIGFSVWFIYWIIYKFIIGGNKMLKEDEEKRQKAFGKAIEDHNNFFASNTFELVDLDPLKELIRKNEKKIEDIKKDEIHKFLRCFSFIKNYKSEIEQEFIIDSKGHYLSIAKHSWSETNTYQPRLDKKTSYFQKCKDNLDQIYFLSYTMIEHLINQNMTDYYEIYEILDDAKVFHDKFERDVVENLEKLNLNLNKINVSLERINKKLNYQNLVLTYSAIQLGKIKKLKTKKLD